MLGRTSARTFCAFIALLIPFVARGANKTWTAAVSGDFGAAANWTGGVPGAADSATFNAAGTYTVTFDNSPNPLANPVLNQDLFFQAGTVTFTSGSDGPYTHQLTGAGGDDALITGGTLTLGTSGNPLHLSADGDLAVRGGAALNVRFGSNVSADRLLLANLVSSNGTILVDGAGSTLDLAGVTGAHNLGGASTGTLRFQNGAVGKISGTLNMAVSTSGTADGNLTVASGSTLTLGSLNMMTSSTPGAGQNALVDLRGTLTLSGASTLTMGHANADASSDALIVIGGTGVLNTGTGNININKESLIRNEGGVFNANGNITITGGRYDSGTTFIFPTTFDLAAGRTLTVQGGGSFEALSGSFNGSTVIVDGAGSTLDFLGAYTFANAAGQAVLTVRNDAAATTSNVILGTDQAGAVANVNIESGATLNTFSITMGATPLAGVSGNITVNGGIVAQSSGSTLTIGATDTAAASTLSIIDGSFATGVDGTTVNATGRIVVGGGLRGTLFLNGNTTVDGGSISVSPGGTLNLAFGRTLTAQNNAQIDLGNDASLSDGTTWNINDGAELAATGFVDIGASSTLNIDGGIVDVGTLNLNGGTINFTAGSLSYLGNLSVGVAGLLGDNLTLGNQHQLTLDGMTTVDAFHTLTLDGGTLSTGALIVGGTLAFNSGTLSITGTGGLTIGAGGPFGSAFTLGAGRTLNVTTTATIYSGALLVLESGGTFSAGALANSGTVVLDGVAAILSGTIVTNNGLVRGEGVVTANVTNAAAGEIRAQNGKTLSFIGANGTNAGTINLQGGTLEFAQPLTNGASGQILGRGTLSVGGTGLNNEGHVALSSGITDVFGDVNNNTGSNTIGITISGNADVTFWDDVTNAAGSLFRVSAGSSATFFGTFAPAGSITGTGDVYIEADLTPGASPASVAFDGDLFLGANASLRIELGGTTPGSQFDHVEVVGAATLDGALDVSLIDGFAPALGDSFDVLHAEGGIFGAFAATSLPPLAAGLDWNLIYSNFSVLVQVAAIGLPGDYNANGVVDAADYIVWRDNEGTNNALPNDPIGGMIGPAQYNQWRAHFGQTAGSGAGAVSPSEASFAVPEAKSLTLILIGSILPVIAASGGWRRSPELPSQRSTPAY